jgi:hypothetical protein
MATALGAPDLTLILDRASALASTRAVRSAEWIIFVFLVYDRRVIVDDINGFQGPFP